MFLLISCHLAPSCHPSPFFNMMDLLSLPLLGFPPQIIETSCDARHIRPPTPTPNFIIIFPFFWIIRQTAAAAAATRSYRDRIDRHHPATSSLFYPPAAGCMGSCLFYGAEIFGNRGKGVTKQSQKGGREK